MRMSARSGYESACSLFNAERIALSSDRAASIVAPGFNRPNNCVMRCVRIVTICAPMWCGLVTMLAMISVSAGYGTDGSSTPITVALRVPDHPVALALLRDEQRFEHAHAANRLLEALQARVVARGRVDVSDSNLSYRSDGRITHQLLDVVSLMPHPERRRQSFAAA